MKEILYFILIILVLAVGAFIFINKDIIIRNSTLQAEKTNFNYKQTGNIMNPLFKK